MAQPKIVFLGTGGDSIVVGKQLRASGGIVMQVGDNQFHMDPGPGSLVMARQLDINTRDTTAILASHSHLNHANDVNATVSALTHAGMDNYGVFIGSHSVISGTDNIAPMLGSYTHRWLERVIPLEPGKKAAVNEVEILGVPAKHSDPTTVGFKFFTPEFTLGYTSDTAYTPDLIEDFKETDILILNTVAPFNSPVPDQLSSEDAVKILEQVKPQLAILNHFGIKMISADPLQEAREIQKRTKVQTIAAKDGLTINPISYSANLRQRTLNRY